MFERGGWLIKLRRDDLCCPLVRRTRLCAAKSLLALSVVRQRMIENHCRSSKRVLKPNLKEGLKRTAGGECVRRLSWSLS